MRVGAFFNVIGYMCVHYVETWEHSTSVAIQSAALLDVNLSATLVNTK